MILSLLIGNLLIVSIASVAPLYSDASLQRMLMRNLSDSYSQTGKEPGTISMPHDGRVSQYDKVMGAEDLFEQMVAELDIPVNQMLTQYSNGSVRLESAVDVDGKKQRTLQLAAFSDMENHVRILHGQMYDSKINDHTIGVIVSERTLSEQGLMLGEVFTIPLMKDEAGNPYKMQITGVFENSEEQDLYWVKAPSAYRDTVFMDASLFWELFCEGNYRLNGIKIDRYAFLDYTAMDKDRVEAYLDTVDTHRRLINELGQTYLNVNFEQTVREFVPYAHKANTTIWVLLLPVFILLAVFVFMVSRQMLELEQNEIAIYKSRGANKRQIIGIYLLQSVFLGAVSLAGGIPLGAFLCKVLGATNSFLEFVQRAALTLTVDRKVFGFAVGAAVLSVCAMVLPVLKYANVNIVVHKRSKNRREKPLWNKLFLDIVILGGSLFGLYQFNGQKAFLSQQIMEGARVNPMLFLCASLFMVGAALLILRLFPLIVRLIFLVGQRWWSPALYASFLRIIRTRSNQGFLIVFLILTVSMGIYNAQSARTINANIQERILYSVGADLVLQEDWGSNQGQATDENGVVVIYSEPDFGEYLSMDGIKSVTKVLVDNKVTVSNSNGALKNVMLMGIHTKEFGQTAWFKSSLLPLHYHAYLNAMSQNAQAILVSSNFRENMGYELGSVLTYSNGQGDPVRGIICGFVDYWPSYAPSVLTKGVDGGYIESEQYLIVAHLSQLQASWGVLPYQVWIKTEDSSLFIYEYAEKSGTRYTVFEDAAAELIEAKNDPMLQGTNGVLTIGFICVLVLCTLGFLIFWILSVRSRTLQFGVFRAMGMSMREVISMLINEQILVTGVSIGTGVLVGAVASKLFIPLVQIAYSTADQVLPLEIVSQSSDYVRLFSVIGAVILVCMFVLGWLVSKIKISQALKLGEE